MKKNKLFLQFKSYYKALIMNSYRLWLTLIGISVGIIILFVSTILLDSYKMTNYQVYDSFNDQLIYCSNANNFTDSDVKFFNNQLSESQVTYYTGRSIFSEKAPSNLSARLAIRGVSSNFVSNYIMDVDTMSVANVPTVYAPKWFKGRTWDNDEYNDSAQKVVINYFGAQLLFPESNPLGQRIEIKGRKYEVIGVVANSAYTERTIKQLNKANLEEMTLNEKMSVTPLIDVYMPITSFQKYIDHQAKILSMLINLNENEDSNEIVSNINNYFANSGQNVTANNRKVILNKIDAQVKNLQRVILAISIFFIIISSIIIMNTLFYNIKEKIPEIGIRKALGASKDDILLQITFEGLLYVFSAIIIAIFISAIILLFSQIIIREYMLYNFVIYFDFRKFLVVILIICLVGIISSFIPATVASKMKIVDAIRFE